MFCRVEFPRLVGSLTLYCGDPDIAVDLAQEALARACRHWRRVGGMASLGGWTHRVAINLAHRHFRRQRIRQAAESLAAPAARSHQPDATDKVAVRTAVAGLPRRQRAALVLRCFRDLPVAEVARLMGCREGTVKALTHQAITRLRAEAGLLPSPNEVTDADV